MTDKANVEACHKIARAIEAGEQRALANRPKPRRRAGVKIPRLSPGEEALATHIIQCGLPEPVRQFKFDPKRKWAADFAFPDLKILAEVDGGAFSRGRHVRGSGFTLDCERQNAATLAGWRVYRFTTEQVMSGYAVNILRQAMEVT